jgi:hypothetical protein
MQDLLKVVESVAVMEIVEVAQTDTLMVDLLDKM